MLVVEVDHVGVSVSEAEAGLSFPGRIEAVDPVELDRSEGVDDVAEHAGAADGGELHRVTDQGEPPAPPVGDLDQLGKARGGDHGGLVHDDGPGREVIAALGWTHEAVLDQELVEGVSVDAGLDGEHLSSSGRWRDPEARAALLLEVSDGGSHGGGLAGPGGPDDQRQSPAPSHSGRSVALHCGEPISGREGLVIGLFFVGPAFGPERGCAPPLRG